MANSKKSKKVKQHTRYYLKNGDLVPGITTITNQMNKPALVNWANKLGLEGINVGQYVDELASIGSIAHEAIQAKFKGEKQDLSDYTPNQIESAKPCLDKFGDWYKSRKIKVILCEQGLVSEKYKYGGTLDLYAEIEGKLTLLDWKTGSGLYDEHKIQLSANRQLLEENGHKVERCMLVSIGRNENEDFHEVIVGGLDQRFRQFLALLEVYNIQKMMR